MSKTGARKAPNKCPYRIWCLISSPGRSFLLRSDQEMWTTASGPLRMFVSQVRLDQRNKSQFFVRISREMWTRVWSSLWVFVCNATPDQLTKFEALFCSEQRGEQEYRVASRVPITCVHRRADLVSSFASRWTKQVNKRFIRAARIAPDIRSDHKVAVFCLEATKRCKQQFQVPYEYLFPTWGWTNETSQNILFTIAETCEQKFQVPWERTYLMRFVISSASHTVFLRSGQESRTRISDPLWMFVCAWCSISEASHKFPLKVTMTGKQMYQVALECSILIRC